MEIDSIAGMASELLYVRKRRSNGIFDVLTSAACEWFLIMMLFVNAVFSYLLRRFAHYCELETPCPLCSRVDHVFGLGSCWSLVCLYHKEEMSSLVCCFTHGNLVDVHGMCEECLLPIVKQNNSESHKLLVGKMWLDVERSVLQSLMVNKHFKLGSSEIRTCSCCNKTWKAKSNAERLVELNKVGLGAYKANVKPPLPRVPSQSRMRRRDTLKRLRGKSTGPKKQRQTGSNSIDTLCNEGFSAFKFSSDSESELSEDDDGGGSVSSEISTRDIPQMPVSNVVLNELKIVSPPINGKNEECSSEDISVECELRSLHVIPPSSTVDLTEKHTDTGGASENMCMSMDVLKAAAEISLGESCSPNSNCTDQTHSSSQIAEHKEPLHEHEVDTLDTTRTEEYMKPVSQLSTSEVDLLVNHTSLEPFEKHYEPRKEEESSSWSLKRNDSSYESLDGFSVDDIEDESAVDRLKRQVEHDRSCMKNLLRELEEERNASAVAANEAMTMITRLQEEKASLRMEALQYLRMVEEQSHYDMKALETANDLLTEREKEMQDMEYELEFYRNNESRFEDLGIETLVLENCAAASSEEPPATSTESRSAEILKPNGKYEPTSDDSVSFDDEKLYISGCLKKLENKLYKAYCNGNVEEMTGGLNSNRIKDEVGNLQNFPPKMDLLLDFEKHKSTSSSNGSPARYNTSMDTPPVDGEEIDCHYETSDNLKSVAFEKEIAALRERLEALETDRSLLNYASNLLQNGKDGMLLIQILAHQLQELRKIEFRER